MELPNLINPYLMRNVNVKVAKRQKRSSRIFFLETSYPYSIIDICRRVNLYRGTYLPTCVV